MKLSQNPELQAFMSTYLSEVEMDQEEKGVQEFKNNAPEDRQQKVIAQIRAYLTEPELPLEDFGIEGNRWFGELDEARDWLHQLLGFLEAGGPGTGNVVKDSNGTPLAEGDSVQVIKDLKVKGGSSDLKRGTHIKKIHLIDDPGAIECRVEGSTLVLKTMYLKKV